MDRRAYPESITASYFDEENSLLSIQNDLIETPHSPVSAGDLDNLTFVNFSEAYLFTFDPPIIKLLF